MLWLLPIALVTDGSVNETSVHHAYVHDVLHLSAQYNSLGKHCYSLNMNIYESYKCITQCVQRV